MPLVHLKINEQSLDADVEERLLVALTDAVSSVCGEAIGRHTWVIVEGVRPERWGVRGRALSER